MKYLPRNKLRGGYGKKALLLVLIFIFGAIVLSLFDNLITKAVAPLWRGENKFSRNLANIGEFFKTREVLRRENIALKERVSSLELSLAGLSLLEAQRDNLSALLGRKAELGGITVAVLTHPPQSPYDLLVVDAGEREGVLTGSRVSLPEGPEVGVVTQVFPSFSRVKLLSSAGEKVPAVLERHDIPVELEGRGGGNFQLLLPRETAVEIGDRILSSSLRGELLAIVEDVTLEPTDSFKEVLARSPANIFRVRYLVIRP